MHFGRTSLVRKLEPKKILLLDHDGDLIVNYHTTISKISFISKIFKSPFFSERKRGAFQLKEACMFTKFFIKDELSIYLYYGYGVSFCESFPDIKIRINEYINRLSLILKNNIDYLDFDINIREHILHYRPPLEKSYKAILRVYFDLNEVKKAIEHFNKNV